MGNSALQCSSELRARERQQAAVARLGQQGLLGTDLSGLLDQAVALVAEILEMEYVKVLELLPDGSRLFLRAGMGWKDGLVGRASVGTDADSQAGYTLMCGESVVVEDLPTDARFTCPILLREHGVISGLSVIIQGKERPFGVLGAHTRQRRAFTPYDIHFLQAVANVLGAAIERKAAEDALRKSEEVLLFMAEASAVLTSSLDYEATLATVAQLTVPRIADWCTVDMVQEGGAIHRLAAAHVDPAKVEMALDLHRRFPMDPDAAYGVPNVLRTGKSESHVDISDSMLAEIASGDEHLSILRQVGIRSAMFVPLMARGRVLGVINLVAAESGRRFGPADLALAEELAGRAALAVDNARLYREAQKAIRVRDEFLTIAAHELRTPITSVRGFAQLAIRHLDRDEFVDRLRLSQALQVIDCQSRKLSQLVSQLLDVSHLGVGRLVINRQMSDMSTLVDAVVDAARATASGHRLLVSAPSYVPALIDPLRMEQVITNLVDNAIKYSPEGELVEIELTMPEPEAVRLAVRDHGIGIPAEHRQKIFDRFYQAHANRNYGGMGLGLYITHEIVTLHGGHIDVEAPPDGGSRFVVTLPTGCGERRMCQSTEAA